MTGLKCPICNTPLEYDIGYDGDYSCSKCGRNTMFGSEELWQALIDTKKKLDVLHEFVTKLYLNGNITDEQLHWLKRINKKD